jgi:uncharacterized protein YqgQ
MTTNILISNYSYRYTIDFIRDEIRALVENGILSRHQPLYCLAQYIPAREWLGVERELEEKDFLLRDRISDLLSTENWDAD